ncbi:XrtA/PEP-CTERM system TPR-repeat protein PrsT [Hydrogenophaga sp.]|uniref:XrtA/PEP-CTERM system TPR-repeat protein PrsT n=1 Tax=Hydrogenophaga sp. TaxID=1904254 RepID=UPI003F6CCA73
MKKTTLRKAVGPVSLAWVMLLAACGDSDPQKMLASARQYLDANDHPAAIIQLKNALQEAPDLGEARLLLGKALLLNGDAAGAETELQKARELGHPPETVTPLLVRSRLAQGQFQQVTNEFANTDLADPAAQAELKTLVAIAWRQQGNSAAFEAGLQAALKAKTDHAPALIEQARFKAAQRDFDGALAVLDGVLARRPKDEEALKLKGDVLLYGQADPAQALAAYRAAVQARPDFQDAQAGVVRVLMGQGDLDQAAKAWDALAQFAPGRPQTLYLQTQLAFQKKDFKAAQASAQQLLKLTPDSPTALEMAGAAAFQLNAMAQAEAMLLRAVQAAPQLKIARRVLVLTYLRTGQVDKALSALPSDLATNDSDPALLAVAGQAYMVKGEAERAEQLFSRASRLAPKDAAMRTSLAVSQLMAGKTELAMDALQDIAATDAGVMADMALINAHLRKRDIDKALIAIAALEKKRATDPMPVHLRGRALLMRNDQAGARAAFERAQSIDPEYFAATAALAALDVVDGKPQEAQKRFEAAVQRNPKNAPALMALAELKLGAGGSKDEVADLIRKAVDAAPTDKAPRLMLAEHYLRQHDAKNALSTAQAAVAARPDAPELLDALGRAQTANGEHNQALSSFNKMVGLLPGSPLPYVRMATAHSANQDSPAAMQSLRRALEIQPDLLSAQRGLADLAVKANQPSEALAVSRTVQKQRPKDAVGFVLEGDIHAAGKNWGLAADAYRAGLKVAAGPELVIKLHAALSMGGKAGDAERLAADWLKNKPKDPAVPLYLGDRAIAARQWTDAQRHYERVIERQPKNALALNNLAWVAGRLGRTDAVALAERANEAAPNQPAFMDTLAVLLSEKGEHARALALQKKVLEAQPQAPVFKLNLARMQIKAGDKAAARTLLNELAALGETFSGQAEVKELQQDL